MIDFQSLDLLDDTVTELVLHEDAKSIEAVKLYREPEDTNRFAKLILNLQFYIREDPLRTVYPISLQFLSFRTIEVVDLMLENEITAGVFWVLHKDDNIRYILKVVNRPFY